MRIFCLTIFVLMGASAYGEDCWVFKKIDRGSQIKSLKIKMGPSEDVKAPQSEHLAKIEAKDLQGISVGGQVSCSKTSPTRWQCHRSDDGGSFELSLEKENVTFSTSYFVLGIEGDQLTLQSESNDPWIFEGAKCR